MIKKFIQPRDEIKPQGWTKNRDWNDPEKPADDHYLFSEDRE